MSEYNTFNRNEQERVNVNERVIPFLVEEEEDSLEDLRIFYKDIMDDLDPKLYSTEKFIDACCKYEFNEFYENLYNKVYELITNSNSNTIIFNGKLDFNNLTEEEERELALKITNTITNSCIKQCENSMHLEKIPLFISKNTLEENEKYYGNIIEKLNPECFSLEKFEESLNNGETKMFYQDLEDEVFEKILDDNVIIINGTLTLNSLTQEEREDAAYKIRNSLVNELIEEHNYRVKSYNFFVKLYRGNQKQQQPANLNQQLANFEGAANNIDKLSKTNRFGVSK